MEEESSELVLVTREKPHRLIIPSNNITMQYSTIRAANNIDIDTSKTVKTEFEFLEGTDTLDIYIGNDKITSINCYLELSWAVETAANLMQPCYIKFDPENILPIDTEGTIKDNKYIHFNRETFLFNPGELKGKKFGGRLENPVVYKSEITSEGRVPIVQEKEPADAPYVFMPDYPLSRMLYGLGIWEGDWFQHFLDFHNKAVEEKS